MSLAQDIPSYRQVFCNALAPVSTSLTSSSIGLVPYAPPSQVTHMLISALGSTKDNALNEWLAKKDMRYLDNGESLANVGRKIFLTQDFGCELQDTVAEFHVSPRDKMSYPWREASGKPRVLDMPPYYMVNIAQNEKDIEDYSQRSYLTYIHWNLRGQNPLVVQSFKEAIRYSEQASSFP